MLGSRVRPPAGSQLTRFSSYENLVFFVNYGIKNIHRCGLIFNKVHSTERIEYSPIREIKNHPEAQNKQNSTTNQTHPTHPTQSPPKSKKRKTCATSHSYEKSRNSQPKTETTRQRTNLPSIQVPDIINTLSKENQKETQRKNNFKQHADVQSSDTTKGNHILSNKPHKVKGDERHQNRNII